MALQLGLAAAGLAGAGVPAWAQGAWPTKTVTLVVGYPPGGQTDFAGRMVTVGMQKELGQGVVIDNKAGAGGNIGTDNVMRAPADGYRLLVVTGPKRVPAFPDIPTATEAGLKDFEIISFIGLYGPPGLPVDIVKKSNAAMNVALADGNIRKGIVDRGDERGGGTPEQLAKLTRDYYKLYGEIVKANDIRAE